MERGLVVAQVLPDNTWKSELLYAGETYGVSSILEASGRLVASFYACENDRCWLEVREHTLD